MPSRTDLPDGAAVGREPNAEDAPDRGRGRVASSFGSAPDTAPARIDLNDVLIRHPQATFAIRAAGDAMRDAGIHDGDVLLVDRAVQAAHGHVIVAVLDGELTCRRLWRQGGRIRLQAASAQVRDVELAEASQLQVWGVVTTVIRSLLG